MKTRDFVLGLLFMLSMLLFGKHEAYWHWVVAIGLPIVLVTIVRSEIQSRRWMKEVEAGRKYQERYRRTGYRNYSERFQAKFNILPDSWSPWDIPHYEAVYGGVTVKVFRMYSRRLGRDIDGAMYWREDLGEYEVTSPEEAYRLLKLNGAGVDRLEPVKYG